MKKKYKKLFKKLLVRHHRTMPVDGSFEDELFQLIKAISKKDYEKIAKLEKKFSKKKNIITLTVTSIDV